MHVGGSLNVQSTPTLLHDHKHNFPAVSPSTSNQDAYSSGTSCPVYGHTFTLVLVLTIALAHIL